MNKPFYKFEKLQFGISYTFESIGKSGKFLKIVSFQALESNIFNLVLGNYDEINGSIDDEKLSNNDDMAKILATVFQIVNTFLLDKAENFVYIEANTPTKRKLYNRIVASNYSDISLNYQVWGRFESQDFEKFETGKNYESLLIKRYEN